MHGGDRRSRLRCHDTEIDRAKETLRSSVPPDGTAPSLLSRSFRALLEGERETRETKLADVDAIETPAVAQTARDLRKSMVVVGRPTVVETLGLPVLGSDSAEKASGRKFRAGWSNPYMFVVNSDEISIATHQSASGWKPRAVTSLRFDNVKVRIDSDRDTILLDDFGKELRIPWNQVKKSEKLREIVNERTRHATVIPRTLSAKELTADDESRAKDDRERKRRWLVAAGGIGVVVFLVVLASLTDPPSKRDTPKLENPFPTTSPTTPPVSREVELGEVVKLSNGATVVALAHEVHPAIDDELDEVTNSATECGSRILREQGQT